MSSADEHASKVAANQGEFHARVPPSEPLEQGGVRTPSFPLRQPTSTLFHLHQHWFLLRLMTQILKALSWSKLNLTV